MVIQQVTKETCDFVEQKLAPHMPEIQDGRGRGVKFKEDQIDWIDRLDRLDRIDLIDKLCL